jgi:hypothetical protein
MPIITKSSWDRAAGRGKNVGWCPVRAVDLRHTGTEPGTCQRCGRHDLRFVHTLEDTSGGRLDVGAECARRLCQGYVPHAEERRLRNLWGRRSRWLLRDWYTSYKGNDTLAFLQGRKRVRVTIFPVKFGGFQVCIAVAGQAPNYSPIAYKTTEEAMLAALDWLVDMGVLRG